MEASAAPAIDFATFVLSLRTGALVNLGEVEGATSESLAVRLAHARQTIDILAMLEQKTHGNLTGEEERLLHEVLVDLRLRVVKASREA